MRTRVLLGVLALVSLVAVFTTRVSRKMPDFEVYWTAGARAAAGAAALPRGGRPFSVQVPAGVRAARSAAGDGAAAAAKGAWFAVSAVLMVTLLGLSLQAMPDAAQVPGPARRPDVPGDGEVLRARARAGTGEPAVCACSWFSRSCGCAKGREAGAGLLLALAVIVKPYAVIFAPWLATRRHRGALLTMTAGLVVLLLLPAARYGWDGNLRLLGRLVADGDGDDGAEPDESGQRVAERDVHEVARTGIAGARARGRDRRRSC